MGVHALGRVALGLASTGVKLTSNIASVKRRLERLQAGYPEAVGKAIRIEFWKGRFQHIAFVTLRAQWALERNLQTRALYDRMSKRLVDSMWAEALTPLGSRFTLGLENVALGGALDIAAAAEYNIGSRSAWGKKEEGSTPWKAAWTEGSEQNLEATRQAIRDWVMLEKRRTDQDAGLTDEQIASRIEEIIGVSDRAVPRDRTPAMEESAGKLVQAIQSWLEGEGENPPTQPQTTQQQGLPPEVAESWLQAVMLAWHAYVAAHLRDRVELELIKLHQRIKTELI